MKIVEAYNNIKAVNFLENVFHGDILEISNDDVIQKLSTYYAILLEMIDTGDDVDYNMEVMRAQVMIKDAFMNKED